MIDTPYPMEVDTPYQSVEMNTLYWTENWICRIQWDRIRSMSIVSPELYREYELAHLKLIYEFSIYNVWKSVQYGVSNGLDTAYWGFLGARIRRILLMDTAYWSLECIIGKLPSRHYGFGWISKYLFQWMCGTDNQEKDEKQSQNDKTELGMEKTVKDKAKSKPESQSSQKVNRKVNWSKSKSTQVNPGAKVKEI
ncbi:hypothetical protein Tco_0019339 [Tanacetum coccineum]